MLRIICLFMCMDKIIHVALGKKATGHLYDTFICCVSLHLGFFRHIFFLGYFFGLCGLVWHFLS